MNQGQDVTVIQQAELEYPLQLLKNRKSTTARQKLTTHSVECKKHRHHQMSPATRRFSTIYVFGWDVFLLWFGCA